MAKSDKGARAERRVVSAKLYKGLPTVELIDDDKVQVRIELTKELSADIVKQARKGPITISLESLDVDLQHNQSFGMISASTGCMSNPGGPGC